MDQRVKILPNGDAVREYVELALKAHDMADPAQAKIALEEDLRAILADPPTKALLLAMVSPPRKP